MAGLRTGCTGGIDVTLRLPLLALAGALALGGFGAPAAARDANKTRYPIVLAHGLGGFDDILGFDYWGDDLGTFVLDPCSFLEIGCNPDIHGGQASFIAAVQPLQNSEVRGLQLYNAIRGYMASSGTTYINLVGHSQGGLDMRKAARLLRTNLGYRVVRYGISISSPHRGSPIAKHILGLGNGVTSVINALFTFYGDIVYAPGNDGFAALKQLIHDDWPGDTLTTGTKLFNQAWPNSSSDIERARSFITAQQGLDVNPALYLIRFGATHIDGDGYATTDADNDGALGVGNGNPNDTDDDGLVGINSAQMGLRLRYTEQFFDLDVVTEQSSTGNTTDLNAPAATAMTSHAYVINQDHLDPIGVPPDLFDEMEFYAALTDYIADGGM
jgi:triacylglycerol esterase/lipase EstA (alpha/beta hydrolase family)